MSQNNDSANYTSDSAQREHKDEENSRFGRGRRGTQEENSQDQGQKPNNSKGSNKDSNKSDSGSEKNNQNNQQNSETPQENSAPPEGQNQGETSNQETTESQNPESNENDGQNNDESNENDQSNDGRRRDDKSDDGRGRDDQSDGGHGRDNNSDGRSEQGEFDEYEEEEDCERPEPEEGEEECEPHNPELDQQGNPNHPNGPNHDDSDHSDHGGPGHHLPPGGPDSQAPSYRPGFMERTSAYTLTFSSETMFEVLLGSLLILVSAVFLFIYLVKRQRRKTMRSHSPVQFVTPNQNIATSNFYQYYQKEGLIPTGTVVGYIPEGQFLQPGAKNVQNLKSFGRMPTQDEILDLS